MTDDIGEASKLFLINLVKLYAGNPCLHCDKV
jgi:hypothetical protein